MVIRLESDYSEFDREFDRLESMPGPKARMLLDAVLHKGFILTQAAVHVETGALKASGEEDSEVNKATHTWEGDITYGDPGDDGPVDYAIYEKERGVGGAGGASDAKGDHDFMRPLDSLDLDYRMAMKEALRP